MIIGCLFALFSFSLSLLLELRSKLDSSTHQMSLLVIDHRWHRESDSKDDHLNFLRHFFSSSSSSFSEIRTIADHWRRLLTSYSPSTQMTLRPFYSRRRIEDSFWANARTFSIRVNQQKVSQSVVDCLSMFVCQVCWLVSLIFFFFFFSSLSSSQSLRNRNERKKGVQLSVSSWRQTDFISMLENVRVAFDLIFSFLCLSLS